LDIYTAAPLQQELDDAEVALLHGPHKSGLSALAPRVLLCKRSNPVLYVKTIE
jgi:hypothetical protein